MTKSSCYNYQDNRFVYSAGDLNTSPEYLNHALKIQGARVDACDQDGDRALHRATRIGRINLIKILFEYKANPDALNNNNYTALDLSKQMGQVTITNLLIDYQRFYSLPTIDYNYLYAAKNGNFTEVKNSLKHGANLKATTRDLSTGLHLALSEGHFRVAEHLVKRKIDLYARDLEGNTALHLAAKTGNFTFTKTLVDQYSLNILNNNHHTAADLATQNNHSKVANMLIKYQRFYSLSPWDANFLYAAKIGNFTEVKNALGHGANPKVFTPEFETALHLVSIISKFEIVEYLIDYHNADVNALDINHATPIHYTLMNDNNNARKIITKLLKAGADVNLNSNDNYSFLYKISYRGYHKIVNIILKNITDINEANNDHNATALHAAVMHNHPKIVYLLVAKGIDITLTNFVGKTALGIAWESSFSEIVAYLRLESTRFISASANGKLELVNSMLAKGTPIESSEHYGHTALDMAVENGHENVVVSLLDQGAKIRITPLGYTPLHAAARKKYYKIMDILIDHGARLDQADFLGTTATDLAREYKYHNNTLTEQLILGNTTNTYLDDNEDL